MKKNKLTRLNESNESGESREGEESDKPPIIANHPCALFSSQVLIPIDKTQEYKKRSFATN